jgi:hypothetical protein
MTMLSRNNWATVWAHNRGRDKVYPYSAHKRKYATQKREE